MKSEFAFKVFLVTTCLFIVYLYAFLVFSFYVPYVDLILFFGFIWAFVKAREGEKSIYRRITLCGTAVLVILYFLLCMIFGGNVKAYDYSYAFTSINDGREEMAP